MPKKYIKKKDDCLLPCKTLFSKTLIFLCVLDRFNVLISKIILKKIKKYYFDAFRHKNTLKKTTTTLPSRLPGLHTLFGDN